MCPLAWHRSNHEGVVVVGGVNSGVRGAQHQCLTDRGAEDHPQHVGMRACVDTSWGVGVRRWATPIPPTALSIQDTPIDLISHR
jgi:hypothetical protein